VPGYSAPPVDLALVAIWSFCVAVAGGIAGLVLGNLRLPLVLQFSSSASAGAGANVAISAASALTASIAHWRGGRIEWSLFWLMAPPSLLGGIAGGLISGVLPQRLLLAVIALVVLYGALEVRRQSRNHDPSSNSMRSQVPPHGERSYDRWVAIAIAFVVGVLGGLVGLILGTLRLPAMVRWLGTAPKAAVGTNAATGVVVGVGGLIGHIAGGVDWDLLAAGCAGAVPGAYLGARLTGRLDDRTLLRTIAAILLVAGISLALQAVLG
jgi:uncharacterized membrane protein YfcA